MRCFMYRWGDKHGEVVREVAACHEMLVALDLDVM